MSAIKLELFETVAFADENGNWKSRSEAAGRHVIVRREAVTAVVQNVGFCDVYLGGSRESFQVVGDYAQIAERCGL